MTPEVLVNIDVNDLAKATEFYCNALDLRVGRRFGDSGVELLGASSAIYLLEKASGSAATTTSPQRRDYSRHWTPIHLDFIVPEINAAVQRAVSAGARLEVDVRTAKWGRIAVLADPFGHGYDEIADPR